MIMPTVVDAELQRLDAALGRLRRMWESPALRRRFLERLGEPVEAATIRTLRAIEYTREPGVREVAERLGVDASTASRLVEQAVRTGYIDRTPSATDGRRCVLSLTSAGVALLERATTVRTELIAEWVAGWPERDVTALAGLVERLAHSIFPPETSFSPETSE